MIDALWPYLAHACTFRRLSLDWLWRSLFPVGALYIGAGISLHSKSPPFMQKYCRSWPIIQFIL